MAEHGHDHPGDPAATPPTSPTGKSPTNRRSGSINPNKMTPEAAKVGENDLPTLEQLMGMEVRVGDFLVPSKDNHGHSERIYPHIQPGWIVEMESIVKSRRWPYRSMADVVRHAINRHLHWLNAMYPIPSVLGQVDAILDVVRVEELYHDFDSLFDAASSAVQKHISKGNARMAQQLLRDIKRRLDDMPEDSDWKETYMREFENRFGNIMKEVKD